ncbi:MAG: hypothetical protein CSA58_01540 [Micrococcales bacterium]|nr:MAG: hypothetical protein CSB46_11070 [Micrococcales bacterium]PIE27950.1 MAG: hypothetical protein CSA58_01540 [Micrococcales bacterium]
MPARRLRQRHAEVFALGVAAGLLGAAFGPGVLQGIRPAAASAQAVELSEAAEDLTRDDIPGPDEASATAPVRSAAAAAAEAGVNGEEASLAAGHAMVIATLAHGQVPTVDRVRRATPQELLTAVRNLDENLRSVRLSREQASVPQPMPGACRDSC